MKTVFFAMKANKKEVKTKLEEAIEPIVGENSSNELYRMALKSTKKLVGLIADFLVKSDQKRKN
jgi:hypothetical protein